MGFDLYIKAVFSLIAVLGLIGIASIFFKKFLSNPDFLFKRFPEGRLSIKQIVHLDTKRKLVLIKRDDIEHLVLLGATSELLIESNIPAKSEKKDVK